MFGGDLPIVPGFDAAGVTADGRRVFGATSTGAYAEVCVLQHWADMPDGLSFEEAASYVTLAEAAVRSLELVGVGEGTSVAIAGAQGAVGSTAVQIARARGAHVHESLDGRRPRGRRLRRRRPRRVARPDRAHRRPGRRS